MKIYTKFGDQGQTRLVGGACVQKSNPRVECYGTVDELNSALGVALSFLPETSPVRMDLLQIQNELFNLGSLLACEKKETLPLLPPIRDEQVSALENRIDQMTTTLPELKQFILPGGTPSASSLHLARTICRRAERHTVGLHDLIATTASEEELVPLRLCLIYLNRLSDFLFVAARYVNNQAGCKDQIWKK